MIEKKACKQCKKKFYGTSRAKFCSGKCRVKSHRLSKNEGKDNEKTSSNSIINRIN